ncbi:MAG: antibiotic biosynthesis monooxygenase [Deltaproteobacteria bacterium]|nr:antibiotic biosynthesis monooxygenase [Deltaproteobacteria bacterium]
MSDNITCVARFTAKSNFSKELKDALHSLVGSTRKESGCISYNLYEGLENSLIFTMIEKFVDSNAFEFHSIQPYLLDFKKNATLFIDNVSIDLYKKIY